MSFWDWLGHVSLFEYLGVPPFGNLVNTRDVYDPIHSKVSCCWFLIHCSIEIKPLYIDSDAVDSTTSFHAWKYVWDTASSAVWMILLHLREREILVKPGHESLKHYSIVVRLNPCWGDGPGHDPVFLQLLDHHFFSLQESDWFLRVLNVSPEPTLLKSVNDISRYCLVCWYAADHTVQDLIGLFQVPSYQIDRYLCNLCQLWIWVCHFQLYEAHGIAQILLSKLD